MTATRSTTLAALAARGTATAAEIGADLGVPGRVTSRILLRLYMAGDATREGDQPIVYTAARPSPRQRHTTAGPAAVAFRSRVATLLGARPGGTSRAELENILDASGRRVLTAITRLLHEGVIVRHGDGHSITPRYTLTADPLTREIRPHRAHPADTIRHRARSSAVLAQLANGAALSWRSLVRRTGMDPLRPRQLQYDLTLMVQAGQIEVVGRGASARYRVRS